MPTYDYTCEKCGHALEASQKISDEPLKHCPSCKNDTLKRGIGGGSAIFRFVGEGFYINDYKTKQEECSPGNCKGACDQ
ncbi:MAG: zinc ribbon domain-containing protein [Chlamydiales bacterium]|nr:zinc ribbon domain-containing protein [Chlamydiales bacterium]